MLFRSYEPTDSRKVTLSNDTAPGEPDRTGPREGESRRGEQSAAHKNARPASDDPLQSEGQSEGRAQAGYGNSRDADGTMEQDARPNPKRDQAAGDEAVVGETAADPARQAEADAKRPLGGA